MQPEQTDLLRRLRLLAAADDRVQAAYLHGSHVSGYAGDDSDIDLALLADASLDKKDRHALRLDIMRRAADAFCVPLERIDLVVLQDVPVLLRYNVLRKGVRAFERDRSARIDFELRTEQNYDDERYYLDREGTATIRRILSPSA